MLKAEDLARREDHRVRGVKSGRTRPDRGISHVCIKLLYANIQCVYIVYTKYQMLTVKALEQVEFPVHSLFEHSRPL